MNALHRAPATGKRVVAGLLGLALVVAIVVVFSGTLTRSTDIEAQAEQVRVETARIAAQVEEGERELEFVASDDFIDWRARAVGFGEKDEQPFTLADDAPSPQPIVPIGPQEGRPAARAPFDAWMELLFGA